MLALKQNSVQEKEGSKLHHVVFERKTISMCTCCLIRTALLVTYVFTRRHESFAGVYFCGLATFCACFAGTNFCDQDRLDFLAEN